MSSRSTRMDHLIPYDPDHVDMENALRAVLDRIVDENAYYKNGRRHLRMVKVGQCFQDLVHRRPNEPYQYGDAAFRRSYAVIGGIPSDAEGIRLENLAMQMLTEDYGICLNTNYGGLPRKFGDDVYSPPRPGALYMVVAKMKIKNRDDLKEAMGTDSFTMGTDKKTLGTDKKTLGIDKVSLGIDAYSMGTDSFTMGTDKKTLGTDKKTLGIDKVSLGLDKETLGLDKDTLGISKYKLGTNKVRSKASYVGRLPKGQVYNKSAAGKVLILKRYISKDNLDKAFSKKSSFVLSRTVIEKMGGDSKLVFAGKTFGDATFKRLKARQSQELVITKINFL
eukprot:g277.t1